MILARSTLAALFVAASLPASAHVVLETPQAAVGAPYKAVFRLTHGCDGSPTTKVRVRIPNGVIAVKPMPKYGWDVALTRGAYAKAYAFFHGQQLSEGVREVVWTGRLPDEHYDELVLSMFLADDLTPGETLHFPTEQECETGAHRWVEVPSAGVERASLKEPAPALRLLPKRGGDQHAQHGGGHHGGAAKNAAKDATAFKTGDLTVEAPWLRATPQGARVAGGYMRITNNGSQPDRLVGGTLEGAGRFEIHEMTTVNDVMRMRPLKDGLVIKPGETVELKPGGLHIMGMDLKGGYREGGRIQGTLQFERAGTVAIEYAVGPLGGARSGGHKHH